MSFRFNWGRLDETAAEAIRHFVNARLSEKLEEVFHKRDPSPGGGSGGNDFVNSNPSSLDDTSDSSGSVYTTGVSLAPVLPASGLNAGGPGAGVSSTGSMAAGSTQIGSTSLTFGAGVSSGTLASTGMMQTGPRKNSAAGGGGSGGPTGSTPGGSYTTAEPRLPPLEYLCISNIEWGTTPPYVEIISIDNALQFAPDTPLQSFSATGASPNVSTSALYSTSQQTTGMSRGHAQTNSFNSSTAGGATSCRGSSSAIALSTYSTCVPCSTSVAPSSNLAVADNGSDTISSAGGIGAGTNFCANSSAINTSGGGGSYNLGGGGGTAWGSGGSRCSPSYTSTFCTAGPGTSVEQQQSAIHSGEDTLASFLGPGGLYLRLHVTYGGSMRFALSACVQHEVSLGPISLPVRIPITLYVSEMDLDCYVCVNLIHNECRLWLEPGKLSSSPINRMNVTAVFGEKGDGADGDVSSLDYLSRYDVSHSDEEDDSVYVDERAVCQFITRELKAILQEKLVAPHFVRIPMVLCGDHTTAAAS